MPSAIPATWVPWPSPSSGSLFPSVGQALPEKEVASHPATHLGSSKSLGSFVLSLLLSEKSSKEKCSLSTPVSRIAITIPDPS